VPLVAQAALRGVSRASLYYQPVAPAPEEVALKHHIDALYTESPFYGSRRIAAVLRCEGTTLNRNAAQRRMREMGIAGIAPGPHTSKRCLEHRVYPYLLRHTTSAYPNHVWGIENAYCEPRPDPPIALLAGGSGEKKILRVVVKHADLWNGAFSTSEAFAHKQAVLAAHCHAIGRDPRQIVRTYYGLIDLSDAQAAAGQAPQMHVLNGDAEQVARESQAFIALGVRHFMVCFTDFPSPRRSAAVHLGCLACADTVVDVVRVRACVRPEAKALHFGSRGGIMAIMFVRLRL